MRVRAAVLAVTLVAALAASPGSAPASSPSATVAAGGGSSAVAVRPNVVVPYGDATGGTSWRLSTDGGRTFRERGSLPAGGDADVAGDEASNRVYLVAPSRSGDELLLFVSADGGRTFLPPTRPVPAAGGVTVGGPAIAVDNREGSPGQGNVYLAWHQGGTGAGVFVTRSADGGESWDRRHRAGATVNAGTGQVAVPIPAGGRVTVPLVVPDSTLGTVLDVDASVRIAHPTVGDLVVELVAPGGEAATLAQHRGGSGDDFGTGSGCDGTPAAFDDDVHDLVRWGHAPFAGAYRPDEPLDLLAGRSPGGTWTLRVANNGRATGTLSCAGTTLTTTADG